MTADRPWRQVLSWVGAYPHWLVFDPEQSIRIDPLLMSTAVAPADEEEREILDLARDLAMVKRDKRR